MFQIAKEMNFDENAIGMKSNKHQSLIRLLESPAIMAGCLKERCISKPKVQNPKESKRRWFSSDPDELCDRLKLVLREKQAAKSSNIINYEIFAIADKLVEYNCISTKQHSTLVEMFH